MKYITLLLTVLLLSCTAKKTPTPEANEDALVIDRAEYQQKLHGFWLGQSIANWTGLVTEMDKIGNIGEIQTGEFYTRDDWGTPDQPSIWGEGIPSNLSPTIDFVFENDEGFWGADDDTDIEYMYQHLMHESKTPLLSGEQIRDGWLTHIKAEEENYLWVSNQKAFDLMQDGLVPPETGNPANNEYYSMIDAQLTTEIFGLFAPAYPKTALELAQLPIQTTARFEAQEIAEFYVIMYSLAAKVEASEPLQPQLMENALEARKHLSDDSYPAAMFDFVLFQYERGFTWEETRDDVYQRYQVEQLNGYDITSQNLYCNGCFAAGINFASSLVSLFFGEGDLIETIKIGVLAGWDSDNPTATWGGMLGFILGKQGVEAAFDRSFSEQFHIHRTRQGFPDNGFDTFSNMAHEGVEITDLVVTNFLNGSIDTAKNQWIIPANQ